MRIGFGRLAQKFRPDHSQSTYHALSATCTRSFKRCYASVHSSQLLSHALTTTSKRLDQAENAPRQFEQIVQPIPPGSASRFRPSSKAENDSRGRGGSRGTKPEEGEHDPEIWASRLNDIYLGAGAPSPDNYTPGSKLFNDELHIRIMDHMTIPGRPMIPGIDMFTYMGIEQGRWKAVLWLANTLLQNVSTRMPSPRRNTECPSNIVWGSDQVSLDNLTKRPFSVKVATHTTSRTIEAGDTFELDPKYATLAADTQDRVLQTMKQVWKTLGCLIITAADLPEAQSEIAMAIVYQIIAKVHALGLVPDKVYSYEISAYSSMVSRPPILHLLSSRVLTTLSDATWRSHQMEVISQAVSTGIPLQSLVKDLPGGRFRLKVRPLGPEVWLELVLWCCVEGGFASTGGALIRQLQQKADNPWFAVPWMSKTDNALSSSIDWERVHSRHGGSVGLIEGYNRHRPFVEMKSRTVSAEAVLMLVEATANSVNTGTIGRPSGLHRVARQEISRLIKFLEPHSLPSEYFDYLSVRMLQTGAFEDETPVILEWWAADLSKLRLLESTLEVRPVTATFEVSSIIQQSEVHVGILHQVLEAHVENFDIRSAIAVFNRIQELVDVSKVQSISAFLATASPYTPESALEETALVMPPSNLDFVRSHGQLPLHKLAAFLNLTTDSKLFRIGQWLLSTDEVDEPVIPKRLFDRPALANALVRYAGASGDQELVAAVIGARRNSPLLPSVSLLRSLVDALMSTYAFQEAHKVLRRLQKAKGGGPGPKNLASSVAAILALDSGKDEPVNIATDRKLREAWELLNRMMSGGYSGRTDIFRKDVLGAYRQQLAALLMVMSRLPHSQVSWFGRKWMEKFPLSNSTTLATDTFNVVLAGVVDRRGAMEGMKLFQSFCYDRSPEDSTLAVDVVMDDILAEDDVLGDDVDYDLPQRLHSAPGRAAISSEYVPFVDSSIPDEPADGSEDESSIEQFEFVDAFPIEADEPVESEPPPGLLVKPDLRTLRIIVRGAVAERLTHDEEGADTSPQLEVLQWAARFYRQFGTSAEVIEQEVRLALKDPSADGQQRSHRAKVKVRQKVAAATARNSKLGHVYKQFHG